ncbi:hypothetical protein NEMBOFW57_004643 [Staphylotrichum longicolle]|uniref:Phosphatase n=1 Tax=Staphylotrichum longicolle TaxID=669026 RepID=A0AAD4F7I7_9PEZI|nr:hypothetical protein NEMBOFW57_004643 [Staphylotrichum longicolle]
MRLFLVRHGETVDNVAGVYAGTRDSPLTAHGVIQARRLGAHLAARAGAIGRVTHVLTSDLKRAVETAEAVVAAQVGVGRPAGHAGAVDHDGADDGNGGDAMPPPLRVVQRLELRERDFCRAEGAKFGAAPSLALAGAESREQMRLRAEKFVEGDLAPLLLSADGTGGCVVVVAHGLILDSLLRVLLARFGSAEAARLGSGGMTGWSNTGYVELVVRTGSDKPVAAEGADAVEISGEVSGDRTPATPAVLSPPQPRATLSVVGVNVLKHLEGLKKTRGGIGSAQFDKRQRTMDSFFGPSAKKARVEKESEEA